MDDPDMGVEGTALSPNADSGWTEVSPSAASMNADRLKHSADWLASGLAICTSVLDWSLWAVAGSF